MLFGLKKRLANGKQAFSLEITVKQKRKRKEEKMRKLVYKCFTDNHFIKTVTTYKEAKEWKEANEKNSFKDEAVDIKREETEKERKTRLERIAKRMKKIRDKQAV